jgi:hypothetical protein
LGDASPGVIVFTSVGVIAAVYAFICEVRAERVARVAVRRVRAAQPGLWQSLVAENWLLRFANPAITIKLLCARHGARDTHFDEHFERVRQLQRRGHIAIGVASVSIALVLIGTRFWGWTWD